MDDVERNGGPVTNKRHSQLSEGRNSYHGSARGSHRSGSNRSSYADDPPHTDPLVPPGDEEETRLMGDAPDWVLPSSKRSSSHYGSKLDTRLEMTPDGSCHIVAAPLGSSVPDVGMDTTHAPGEELEFEHNKCTRAVEVVQHIVHNGFHRHAAKLKKAFIFLLVIAYSVYLGFAIYNSVDGAMVILVLTGMVVFYLFWNHVIWRFCGKQIRAVTCAPASKMMEQKWWKYCRWTLYGIVLVGLIIFLVVDVGSDGKRLTSAAGMVIFILLGFITSTNPSRVDWRPVLWGISLQFLLGLAILRWSAGFHFFKFMGDQVKVFLEYTDEGSKFVFGEEGYLMHRMAFKIFPIVIYFSAVISIFYYWGLMQFIVCRIASLMQFTMGTTAIESLNAATNIFIGMAESCVILRPFLPKLTKSELHAVMSGGFATVAGSYIALLVEVGAPAEHLLSAAIMSAPAALAMGKLSYPETEVSQTRTSADVKMDKTPARNVVEAASNGAIAAITVVASVAANLIAIIGLIAFFNATLSYVGARVGFPQLTFQLICSYMFWPLAAIMGVDLDDAGHVASLLGTKVFVDEFISFRDLGIMVAEGRIGERSRVIATYACCGFGSIAAVGVYIGALVSVAPGRRGDISEVALRAVVNGNVAGFLTACIAGILYTEDSLFSTSYHANNPGIAASIINATTTIPGV